MGTAIVPQSTDGVGKGAQNPTGCLIPRFARAPPSNTAHGSKADVSCAEISFLGLSRRWPVASTIVRRAQEGPALDDFAGKLPRREANLHEAWTLWFVGGCRRM